MAAVAGSLCEAAAATAAAATLAPPGCGIWSVVLAGCGMVRGFVFTIVAAVGGATTFGIRIAEAAEGGADDPAGAEMTMVPGAGAEVTALATTAGVVDRFTGFIWEGAAT